MELNFKNICINAIKAYELVNRLKSETNNENDLINLVKREQLKQICIDLNSCFEFVTNKKSVCLVKKKKNKKKHAIKSSKNLFYHHELENILKNKELFWENKSNNVISSIDTEHHQTNNSELNRINNSINEIKELKEHVIIYSKLITIRVQHNHKQPTTSLIKINDLINQLDTKLAQYENEKRKIKEQIKSFKLNSIKYEQIRQKEIFNTNLIQIENSIKEYLFGVNKPFEACNSYELFHRQAENSFDQLILIRQEWDNFVSDSSKAESVPIEWVFVDTLSKDDEWLKFAKIMD